MAQVVAPPFQGLMLGSLRILAGRLADPNAGPDNGTSDLAGSALGSLFLSTINGGLWSKTEAASTAAPFGVWTAR